jgi:hypothetical protein
MIARPAGETVRRRWFPWGVTAMELNAVQGKAALIEPVVEPMASLFETRGGLQVAAQL